MNVVFLFCDFLVQGYICLQYEYKGKVVVNKERHCLYQTREGQNINYKGGKEIMFNRRPYPYIMLIMLSQVDDKKGDESSDLVTTSPCRFCQNGVVLNMGSWD